MLIRHAQVTGFTNGEEAAVGLTGVVPMLVENQLIEKGGNYSKADNFAPYIRVDGNLITGQNPASSESVAEAVLKLVSAV
ncbi:MAG: putative intracellular protease/amidase [Enterobacterales bacterium]|jgi:putative intracellular protease/amidase